jgi:hypothetical protein
MRFAPKGLLVIAALAAAAVSRADITFDNIVATVTYEDQTTANLDVAINGHEIDFSALNDLIYIDSVNADHTFALVEISYDATSKDGISGMELIFNGWALGGASISYRELVRDGGGTEVASVAGTRFDGPFVQTDFLDFGGELNEFSVEKAFVLQLNEGGENARIVGPQLATIGLIEQNAVPEPATMGALAVGALGLLARRRRK